MKLQNKYKLERHDVLALAACLVMFALFLVGIRFRIGLTDESAYFAGAQRFARGERPLVDEMHLAQFSCFFLMPFYSLFKAVTGGTEGLILFMRHVYLLLDFACYWILYRHLRSYRVWGVVVSVLVCSYVPWSIFTLNYYTLAICFLLLFCVVLFLGKKEPSGGKLILAGVLLSCAVVVQPPFAFLYVFYTVAVLVFEIGRKKHPDFGKNYAFFFNRRHWLFMTLAVAVCAGVFVTVLGVWSGWKNIFDSIPLLLSDADYPVFEIIPRFFREKVPELLRVCGVVNCVLAAVVLLAAVLSAALKKNDRFRPALFFASSCLFLLSFSCYLMFGDYTFLYVVQDGFNNSVFPVALMGFGLVNYLLCKERNCRLFMIWLVSVLASLFMDLFSANSIGYCGILSVIPGMLWFKQVLDEFTAEDKAGSKGEANRKKKGTAAAKARSRNRNLMAASFAVLLVFLAWKGFMIGFERYAQTRFDLRFNSEESTYASLAVLDEGPHKGMISSKSNCAEYKATLRDMDLIRQETDGPVLLEEYSPLAFLYLDRPSVSFSVLNPYEMTDRQLRYFLLHPEKQPGFIGLQTAGSSGEPYTEESRRAILAFAEFLCEGTVAEGERGIVVKVSKWNTHSPEEVDAWLAEYSEAF